jgi:DNA-directed RNA polymerase subunit beta
MLLESFQQKLTSSFPIIAQEAKVSLLSSETDEPLYTEAECRLRGLSYTTPIRLRLLFSVQGQSDEITRQEDVPRLTTKETWLVQGREFSPLLDIHKPPGVFFLYNDTKKTYRASLLPKHGVKLHVEIDAKEILTVYIEQQKVPASLFFSALGYYAEDIFLTLGKTFRYNTQGGQFSKYIDDSMSPIPEAELLESISAQDIFDQNSGLVLVEANEKLTSQKLAELKKYKIEPFQTMDLSDEATRILHQSYRKTPAVHPTDGIVQLFSLLNKTSKEQAKEWLEDLFFRERLYDLSSKGRRKLNALPQREKELLEEGRALTRQDIIEVVRHLFLFKEQQETFLPFQKIKTNEELLERLVQHWLWRWREELSSFPTLMEGSFSKAAESLPTLQTIVETYFQQEIFL